MESSIGRPRDGEVGPASWRGIPVAPLALADALATVTDAVAQRRPAAFHLCNAYTFAQASSDAALAAVLRAPTAVNLLDGVPAAWVLRLAGVRSAGHSRGPSLFSTGVLAYRGHRQVLLGGSTTTAAAMQRRFAADGLLDPPVVLSPPFEALTPAVMEAYTRAVAAHEPDLVWVGLGTPKQDFVVAHLADRLSVPCVAVGAAFDFYAGVVREAPGVLHDTGMEWIFRLGTEPRRLWRRYLFGNAKFLTASLPAVLHHEGGARRAPAPIGDEGARRRSAA